MPSIILSDNGVSSGSAGLKSTAASDGALALQTTTAGGVATTAISIDTSQNVTFANQPTFTGGTANGVLYLNGSKAVTSGSALVFDGTNLGVGVTPSAWSGGKALQVGTTTSLWFDGSGSTYFGNNFYYNGGFKYTSSSKNAVAYLTTDNGQHIWYNAPSGTAGNAITFTTAMTLDSSGNLGLGVTPSAWATIKALQVTSSSFIGGDDAALYVGNRAYYNGGWKYGITGGAVSYYQQYLGAHAWYTAPSGTAGSAISFTQAMTLDASGRLFVGLTSGAGKVNVGGAAGTTGQVDLYVRNTTSGTAMGLIKTGSSYSYAGVGADTSWLYSQGSDPLTLGADGAAPITFVSNGSERARIDSSGNLLVGMTSAGNNIGAYIQPNGKLQVGSSASTNAADTFDMFSTGASAYRFYVDWGGTIHATSTSITAISDQSLKENVRPLETGLAQVMALQPRRFDWINGDGRDVAGFIAQEVEQVLPDLVAPFKYNDEETKLGLKMGDMIPTLVKAIQEQQAIIESLKARLDAANI